MFLTVPNFYGDAFTMCNFSWHILFRYKGNCNCELRHRENTSRRSSKSSSALLVLELPEPTPHHLCEHLNLHFKLYHSARKSPKGVPHMMILFLMVNP
jgi:hypothetical protein